MKAAKSYEIPYNRHLSIMNRSQWPDGFLRVICRWIAAETGIDWAYEFEFPSTKRRFYILGQGWSGGQKSIISRHWRRCPIRGQFPFSWKEQRFIWGGSVTINCRLEGFIFLVSHEARHATRANRELYRGSRGHSAMEADCNRHGAALVKKFREDWPWTLRDQVIREIRLDRDRAKAAKDRKAQAKRPEAKLAQAKKNAANWEKKAKRAAVALKKYRQKIRYYQGRIAAKNNPKP